MSDTNDKGRTIAAAFLALALSACQTSRTVTCAGLDYPEVFDATLTAVRGSVPVTKTDQDAGTIRGETDSTFLQVGAIVRVTIAPPEAGAATYEVRLTCDRKTPWLSMTPVTTDWAKILAPLIQTELETRGDDVLATVTK